MLRWSGSRVSARSWASTSGGTVIESPLRSRPGGCPGGLQDLRRGPGPASSTAGRSGEADSAHGGGALQRGGSRLGSLLVRRSERAGLRGSASAALLFPVCGLVPGRRWRASWPSSSSGRAVSGGQNRLPFADDRAVVGASWARGRARCRSCTSWAPAVPMGRPSPWRRGGRSRKKSSRMSPRGIPGGRHRGQERVANARTGSIGGIERHRGGRVGLGEWRARLLRGP